MKFRVKNMPDLRDGLREAMALLESEEERLAGEIVKVPINGLIWSRKILFICQQYQRFMEYLNTIAFDRGHEKFLKRFADYKELSNSYISSNASSTINILPYIHFQNPGHDKQFYNAIFKLFLDREYLPPTNPFDLREHFETYLSYKEHTLFELKYFYPTVNNYINFAGTMLILDSCKQIAATIKIETKQELAKPGATVMKSLSEQKDKAIGCALEKYIIKDLHVFRKDKILREKFLDECRRKTREIDTQGVPLSDSRILTKARKILKGNALV